MTTRRFPRTARLLSGADFKRVFATRELRQDRFFRIHSAPSPCDRGTARPRLGITVSRRAARRAVDRNRIRRLVRESFRHNAVRLAPRDYVVVARPAATGTDAASLRSALDQLWLRFDNE